MLFAQALIGDMLFAQALIGDMLFAQALIGDMLFAQALIGLTAPAEAGNRVQTVLTNQELRERNVWLSDPDPRRADRA
jgi:hypothetical protein